jgi:glycogen debranching enzyme
MNLKYLWSTLIGAICLSIQANNNPQLYSIYHYSNILDIQHTPYPSTTFNGGFSDEGTWMSFTLPQKENWINGFCGPYDLEHRHWISKSLMEVSLNPTFNRSEYTQTSSCYYPGEITLAATQNNTEIKQRLFYVDKYTALWQCETNRSCQIYLQNNTLNHITTTSIEDNTIHLNTTSSGSYIIRFQKGVHIELKDNHYIATLPKNEKWEATITYLYETNKMSYKDYQPQITTILDEPEKVYHQHLEKWKNYLQKTLRTDMEEAYNWIAVKSVVTLLANWRAAKGDLLHEGIVPSFAMNYFMGFWAWDSWKHAVALSRFAPDLAKNQMRAMFDYQQEDGMVIDCIYPNKNENNYRDSKPPLAAWAVHAIYEQTKDVAFVKEMYPKLLKYYRWWYEYRDHDQNGICEFGSTDGTLIAAAWESGMDNAIRFDNAYMLKNKKNAWSTNQESVDLNAYLAYEYKLLKLLAPIANLAFEEEDKTNKIKDYFYDSQNGFFYDKKITGNKSFIKVEGCESYIPFWTNIASTAQAKSAYDYYSNPSKFGTYIPFPTVTADHPNYTPNGYWRGPIWLDQVYFGIHGLRNYGYNQLADEYTKRVFDRLSGLREQAPIHENYETSTGGKLKSPHFSWSAAHLLMLYWECSSISSLENDLCLFQASYRNFVYIKEVELNNLHRCTNYITSNWQDFSGTDIAVLEPLKTYTLNTIVANWDSGEHDCYKLSLWIDWNQNYQLEEKELIDSKLISKIGKKKEEHQLSFDIKVPEKAIQNVPLKFRLFLHYVFEQEGKEEPCGWVDSGTAQDYALKITPKDGIKISSEEDLHYSIDKTNHQVSIKSIYPIQKSTLYNINGLLLSHVHNNSFFLPDNLKKGIYLLKVSYLKGQKKMTKVFKCILSS